MDSLRATPRPHPDLPALIQVLQGNLHAVVFCLSHSWGGLEQVAASDALDAGREGLRLQVACLEGSPIHERLSGRDEVRMLPLPFRPRNNLDLKLKRELERLIREGVNLVHTHQTSILGSISPWLWNQPQVALVASRHIMNDHNKKDFYHRLIYSRLDAFLAISESVRRNILQTHAVRERRVKVVNLGLDFERFDPARIDAEAQRRKWGVGPDALVVGLVGRIDPAKGQATFIRAAAGLLKNSRPADTRIRFVIVGRETLGLNGAYLDELRKMVVQLQLEDSVIFTGFEEDVPQVMGALDILVMPSRQEAFGLVAIEAMAMECPVILSHGGSAEEIAGPGQEYARLVWPEDAFELQRQIRLLLENPAQRKAMGKRGREHVRRLYDRRERLRHTLEVYERALVRRRVLL